MSMASNPATGGHNNGSEPARVAAPANGWTRKDRPCDACRRRKSRCIIPEGTDICLMCQSRAEECTFVQSPQRRKRRKVETGENSPEANKPRYVINWVNIKYVLIINSVVRSPDAERSKKFRGYLKICTC